MNMAAFHLENELDCTFVRRRKSKSKSSVGSNKPVVSKTVDASLSDLSNDFVDVELRDNTPDSPVKVSVDVIDLLPFFEEGFPNAFSFREENILSNTSNFDNTCHSKFRVTNSNPTRSTDQSTSTCQDDVVSIKSEFSECDGDFSPKKGYKNYDIKIPTCPNDILDLDLVFEKTLKISCENLDLDKFCKKHCYSRIGPETISLKPLPVFEKSSENVNRKSNVKRILSINRSLFHSSPYNLKFVQLPSDTKQNKCADLSNSTSTKPIVIWPTRPSVTVPNDNVSKPDSIVFNVSNDHRNIEYNPIIAPKSNCNIDSDLPCDTTGSSSDGVAKGTDIEFVNSTNVSARDGVLESLDVSDIQVEENALQVLQELNNLLNNTTGGQNLTLSDLEKAGLLSLDEKDVSVVLPNAVFSQTSTTADVTEQLGDVISCSKSSSSSISFSDISAQNSASTQSLTSSQCKNHSLILPKYENSVIPSPLVSAKNFNTHNDSAMLNRSNKLVKKEKPKKELSTEKTISDIRKEMESFMLSAKPKKQYHGTKTVTSGVKKFGSVNKITEPKKQSHQNTSLGSISSSSNFEFGSCSRYNAELDCLLFGAGGDVIDDSFAFGDDPSSLDCAHDLEDSKEGILDSKEGILDSKEGTLSQVLEAKTQDIPPVNDSVSLKELTDSNEDIKPSIKCRIKIPPSLKPLKVSHLSSYRLQKNNIRLKRHRKKKNYKAFLKKPFKSKNMASSDCDVLKTETLTEPMDPNSVTNNKQTSCVVPSTKAKRKSNVKHKTVSNSDTSETFTDFSTNSKTKSPQKENNNVTATSFASRSNVNNKKQEVVENALESVKKKVQYLHNQEEAKNRKGAVKFTRRLTESSKNDGTKAVKVSALSANYCLRRKKKNQSICSEINMEVPAETQLVEPHQAVENANESALLDQNKLDTALICKDSNLSDKISDSKLLSDDSNILEGSDNLTKSDEIKLHNDQVITDEEDQVKQFDVSTQPAEEQGAIKLEDESESFTQNEVVEPKGLVDSCADASLTVDGTEAKSCTDNNASTVDDVEAKVSTDDGADAKGLYDDIETKNLAEDVEMESLNDVSLTCMTDNDAEILTAANSPIANDKSKHLIGGSADAKNSDFLDEHKNLTDEGKSESFSKSDELEISNEVQTVNLINDTTEVESLLDTGTEMKSLTDVCYKEIPFADEDPEARGSVGDSVELKSADISVEKETSISVVKEVKTSTDETLQTSVSDIEEEPCSNVVEETTINNSEEVKSSVDVTIEAKSDVEDGSETKDSSKDNVDSKDLAKNVIELSKETSVDTAVDNEEKGQSETTNPSEEKVATGESQKHLWLVDHNTSTMSSCDLESDLRLSDESLDNLIIDEEHSLDRVLKCDSSDDVKLEVPKQVEKENVKKKKKDSNIRTALKKTSVTVKQSDSSQDESVFTSTRRKKNSSTKSDSVEVSEKVEKSVSQKETDSNQKVVSKELNKSGKKSVSIDESVTSLKAGEIGQELSDSSKSSQEKSVKKLTLSFTEVESVANQDSGSPSKKKWIVSSMPEKSKEIKPRKVGRPSSKESSGKKKVEGTKTGQGKVVKPSKSVVVVKPSDQSTLKDVSSDANVEPVSSEKLPERTPRNRMQKRPFSPTENLSPAFTSSPAVSSASSQAKKKRKSYLPDEVIKPFKFGWMREVVHRAALGKKATRQSDIYYFTPEGYKLRSMPEVAKYLSEHKGTGLTVENFTFAKETIYRHPFEKERDAKVKSSIEPVKETSSSVTNAESRTEKRKAEPERNEHGPARKVRLKSVESIANNAAKDNPEKSRLKSSKTPPVPVTPPVPDKNSAHVKKKKESSSGVKIKVKKAAEKEISNSNTPSTMGGEIDQDVKKMRSPTPELQTPKSTKEPSKKAKIKFTPRKKDLLRTPCTSHCQYASYQSPTIQCSLCSCLFHPSCLPSLPKTSKYVCQPCQVTQAELEIEKKKVKETDGAEDFCLPVKIGEDTEKCAATDNIPVSVLTPDCSLNMAVDLPSTNFASQNVSQTAFLPPPPPLRKAPERSPRSNILDASSTMSTTLAQMLAPSTSPSILQSKLQESASGIKPLKTFVERVSASVTTGQTSHTPPLHLVTLPHQAMPLYFKTNDTKFIPRYSIRVPPQSMVPVSDILRSSDRISGDKTYALINNQSNGNRITLVNNQSGMYSGVNSVLMPFLVRPPLTMANVSGITETSTSSFKSNQVIAIPATTFNSTLAASSANQASTSRSEAKLPSVKTYGTKVKSTVVEEKIAKPNSKKYDVKPKLPEPSEESSSGSKKSSNSQGVGSTSTNKIEKSKGTSEGEKDKGTNKMHKDKGLSKPEKGKDFIKMNKDKGTGKIDKGKSPGKTEKNRHASRSDKAKDSENTDKDEKSSKTEKDGKQTDANSKSKVNVNVLMTDNIWMNMIFKRLDVPDLLRASQVCKSWHKLATQTTLWRNISFKGVYVRNWEKCSETLKKNGTKVLNLRGIHAGNAEENWQNFIKCLENLENVEHLIFDQIPPKVIESVADCLPLLRSLECYCLTATYKRPDLWETPCQLNFSNIRYLRKLRRLKIRSAGGMISQDATSVLQNLPDLKYLSLTTVKISASDHLNFLSSLRHLVSLEFGDCNTWGKESYGALAELKKLQHLRLENGGDFRDTYLPEALKCLKNLEELQLMNYKIPKNLGSALATLDKLRKLSLWPDISKQMAEVNYNAYQSVVQAQSVKYFCWGIISMDDSIPLLKFLKEPIETTKKNMHENVEELDYEDLFERLCDILPDDAKAEIKCISRSFFNEYCCMQR